MSNQCGKFDRETEIANTLLARDYKGFGNQPMNDVISKIETKKTKVLPIGCVYSNPQHRPLAGRGCVYDPKGIAPTILTMSGGGVINHMLSQRQNENDAKILRLCHRGTGGNRAGYIQQKVLCRLSPSRHTKTLQK